MSELTHKITKKQKPDLMAGRVPNCYALYLVCKSWAISTILNFKEMENKEPHRGFWGFKVCIFLAFHSGYFLGKQSLHARKMDIYPFRKFYHLTQQKTARCISIKPDCLHSCLLTTVHSALICKLAPQTKKKKKKLPFCLCSLGHTLWKGGVKMTCD